MGVRVGPASFVLVDAEEAAHERVGARAGLPGGCGNDKEEEIKGENRWGDCTLDFTYPFVICSGLATRGRGFLVRGLHGRLHQFESLSLAASLWARFGGCWSAPERLDAPVAVRAVVDVRER